jgi:hypothetical protein
MSTTMGHHPLPALRQTLDSYGNGDPAFVDIVIRYYMRYLQYFIKLGVLPGVSEHAISRHPHGMEQDLSIANKKTASFLEDAQVAGSDTPFPSLDAIKSDLAEMFATGILEIEEATDESSRADFWAWANRMCKIHGISFHRHQAMILQQLLDLESSGVSTKNFVGTWFYEQPRYQRTAPNTTFQQELRNRNDSKADPFYDLTQALIPLKDNFDDVFDVILTFSHVSYAMLTVSRLFHLEHVEEALDQVEEWFRDRVDEPLVDVSFRARRQLGRVNLRGSMHLLLNIFKRFPEHYPEKMASWQAHKLFITCIMHVVRKVEGHKIEEVLRDFEWDSMITADILVADYEPPNLYNILQSIEDEFSRNNDQDWEMYEPNELDDVGWEPAEPPLRATACFKLVHVL